MPQPWYVNVAIIVAVAAWAIHDARRKAKRRDTLRQDKATGDWVWIDFDGTERRSRKRPDGKRGA